MFDLDPREALHHVLTEAAATVGLGLCLASVLLLLVIIA